VAFDPYAPSSGAASLCLRFFLLTLSVAPWRLLAISFASARQQQSQPPTSVEIVWQQDYLYPHNYLYPHQESQCFGDDDLFCYDLRKEASKATRLQQSVCLPTPRLRLERASGPDGVTTSVSFRTKRRAVRIWFFCKTVNETRSKTLNETRSAFFYSEWDDVFCFIL